MSSRIAHVPGISVMENIRDRSFRSVHCKDRHIGIIGENMKEVVAIIRRPNLLLFFVFIPPLIFLSPEAKPRKLYFKPFLTMPSGDLGFSCSRRTAEPHVFMGCKIRC